MSSNCQAGLETWKLDAVGGEPCRVRWVVPGYVIEWVHHIRCYAEILGGKYLWISPATTFNCSGVQHPSQFPMDPMEIEYLALS